MKCSQNFDFLGLKNLSPSQFWGAPPHEVSLNFKVSCWNLKIRGPLFYYFNFERIYDVSKSKSPCILLNKNINFNKNETESNMENLTPSSKKTNLVLQFLQVSQIKSETVLSWSWWRKKRTFLAPIILSEKNFFKIYVLSQCIVYWRHF